MRCTRFVRAYLRFTSRHQLEEVISYLILGGDKAVLFDTGMGISNIQAWLQVDQASGERGELAHSQRPRRRQLAIQRCLRHGYGVHPSQCSRSKEDAQAEFAPDEICGALPAGFDSKAYAIKPFHIAQWLHDGDKIDLGGRRLKVIATPGHTPDAIALQDEKNGLLFTGDTFYLGPIYLYRPETDLDAYVASVQRLAAMVPHLQLLLPAHNMPVADPSYLRKVVTAMQQVRRGEVKPVSKDGKHEYLFEGFSFLMR